MHFRNKVLCQGHGGHSICSGTWPITRGVGSSSGTNSCFQIQPLFRRWCRWEDPWANCWAARPWVPFISLSTPPGIIEKTITIAKTLCMLILTVHTCIISALPVVSAQKIDVSLVQGNQCFIHQRRNSWCRQCRIPSCYDVVCMQAHVSEIKVNNLINGCSEKFTAVARDCKMRALKSPAV